MVKWASNYSSAGITAEASSRASLAPTDIVDLLAKSCCTLWALSMDWFRVWVSRASVWVPAASAWGLKGYDNVLECSEIGRASSIWLEGAYLAAAILSSTWLSSYSSTCPHPSRRVSSFVWMVERPLAFFTGIEALAGAEIRLRCF